MYFVIKPTQEDNTFIGAGPKYWECPQNWEVKDGVPAKTAPCGRDRAIFEEVFQALLPLAQVTCLAFPGPLLLHCGVQCNVCFCPISQSTRSGGDHWRYKELVAYSCVLSWCLC